MDRFLASNLESGQVPPGLVSLPLAEIFVLAGFYLIYSIEEITHATIDRYVASTGLEGHHSHGHPGELQTMVPLPGSEGQAGSASEKSIHFYYGLYLTQ